MNELVQLESNEGVAILYLNNLPLNVVSRELTRQLRKVLVRVTNDSNIRVVIVTGRGERAFCAGSDIKEFRELMESGEVIEEKLALENFVYDELECLPQPTIAAINGYALGGGAELSLCCDLRVMDSNAKIGFPECKLGVFPGSGGTQRLPRLIGEAKAKELMFFGDAIDAETALRLGLINRIAEPGQVLQAAKEMAAEMSKRPGLSLRSIKEAVHYGKMNGIAAGQVRALQLSDRIFISEDIREGVAAHFEKRAPVFRHR
ncbi:MAG: enoyl-CoA hydratase-related protein [Paenibacillaceae bacterium]